MMLEMVLFIMRAVRMEYVCEQGGGYKDKTQHHHPDEVDLTIDESNQETMTLKDKSL